MPRIGPVAVTSTQIAARTTAGARGTQFTVTLPSNPSGPWTAKAILSDGVEMPVSAAKLTTGTRQLVVTVENSSMWRGATVASVVVDY